MGRRTNPLVRADAGPAIVSAILVGTVLSTPFFGWAPGVIATGAILAVGWVLRNLPEDERR